MASVRAPRYNLRMPSSPALPRMRRAALHAPRALGSAALLAGCLLLGALPRASAADAPYPPGPSRQSLEGLETELVLPRELAADVRASLVIVLHGAGGTATGMAGTLAPLAGRGFVVCAPKSKGQVWEASDLEAVLRIAAHLKSVLPIDAAKVHVVGFSNGGWNLPRLAFDDALRPVSATWVAAGFRAGPVPDWAKTRLSALALAGSDDPNLSAARETVKALSGKVRSVEVREQPGLGHAWPEKLQPYLEWWLGVREGRFTPGDDLSLPWTADLDAALATQAGGKKGGVLLYVFDPADAAKPEARALQHEVLFDPEVRRLGAQLAAVKLTREQAQALGARTPFSTTPALLVLDAKGAVKHALEGKVKASALAKALRSVAPVPREGG